MTEDGNRGKPGDTAWAATPGERSGEFHLWGASSLVVTLAALVALALTAWSAHSVVSGLRENQARLMESEGRSVAAAVGRFVAETDRMVDVFAEQNRDLLSRLLASDEDPDLLARVEARVRRYFPDFFAFTLRDTHGRFVPDDLEEFVGPVCRQDIIRFWAARTAGPGPKEHLYAPFIHPQPSNYHFDSMAMWRTTADEDAVMFISFHPDVLAQTIKEFELPGHDIFLVRDDKTDLIEVSAQGTREDLARPIRLTQEEQARTASSKAVPGTRWVAVVLPEAGTTEALEADAYRLSGLVAAGILLFWFGALRLTARIRRQRERAYAEIRSLNASLEDRVAARTAEVAKLSRALEQSPAMVIITDTDGIIEYVNSRFVEGTGYSPEEARGQSLRLVDAGDSEPGTYRGIRETLHHRRDWSGQIRNRRRDGSAFWVLASISPLRNETGEVTHLVVVEEDITERVAMEDDMRRAKEDAELANRAKSEFLANMSHELRTPLNAIIGFSGTLETEPFGPIGAPQYAEYIQLIGKSGRRLADLIGDLLDVARLETADIPLNEAPLDVAKVLEACRRMIADRAAEAGLELVVEAADGLPRLLADERKLKQVLLNLLGNAVKFTEKGTVRLEAERDGDGAILFRISDTGIGIEPEHMETVFANFGQADGSLARRFEGAGLGLPLSRRLIELHGGTLTLASEPDKGTEATVRFPPGRVVEGA